MDSPKEKKLPKGLRNGYTQISNEILEGLMYMNLTKREYKICLCILRYGYGYKKEKSEIRCHQRVIAKLTGLHEVVIKDSLLLLVTKNIIKWNKLNKTLSFNRHLDSWKLNELLSSERRQLNKTLSKNLIKYEVGTKQNIKSEALNTSPTKEQRVPKERFKEIKEIVDFLNLTLERSFRYQSAKTEVPITARLNEGFILGDFKLVVEDRAGKWRNDGHMKQYLRPETLFGTKMEGYLQEAKDNKKQSEEVIV